MKKLILITLLTFTVGLAPVSAYALEDDLLFPSNEVVSTESNCYRLIEELNNIDLQTTALQQRQEALLEELGSNAQPSQEILQLLEGIKSLEKAVQESQDKIKELDKKYFKYLVELNKVDSSSPRFYELYSLMNKNVFEKSNLEESIKAFKALIQIFNDRIAKLADLDLARVKEIVKELVEISNKIEDLKKKKAEILRKITSDPDCAEMWIKKPVLNFSP
jgi:seryl-tRNA synthetase